MEAPDGGKIKVLLPPVRVCLVQPGPESETGAFLFYACFADDATRAASPSFSLQRVMGSQILSLR
jgi:hypothetical protein